MYELICIYNLSIYLYILYILNIYIYLSIYLSISARAKIIRSRSVLSFSLKRPPSQSSIVVRGFFPATKSPHTSAHDLGTLIDSWSIKAVPPQHLSRGVCLHTQKYTYDAHTHTLHNSLNMDAHTSCALGFARRAQTELAKSRMEFSIVINWCVNEAV